jgi:hypothetical protein
VSTWYRPASDGSSRKKTDELFPQKPGPSAVAWLVSCWYVNGSVVTSMAPPTVSLPGGEATALGIPIANTITVESSNAKTPTRTRVMRLTPSFGRAADLPPLGASWSRTSTGAVG